MNYTIHVIAVQFGTMPNTFSLWEKGAARNPSIRFHLFTDQRCDVSANNIAVHRTDLNAMQTRISSALGLDVKLPRPYKICDYRPMFGLIFAEELAGCDFWGHCDIDLMFGDLEKFLSDDVKTFDKILIRGNFSLYRNNDAMNNLFRRKNSDVDWVKVVSTDENMLFDEWGGIYKIIRHEGVRFYNEPVISDIKVKSHAAVSNDLPAGEHEINIWKNGKIHRYLFSSGGQPKDVQEKILVHLQKRPYAMPTDAELDASCIAFGPNGIVAIDSNLSVNRELAMTLNRPSLAGDIGVHLRRAGLKLRKLIAKRN